MLLSYVYSVVDAVKFDELLPGESRSRYRFNNDGTKFIYKTFREESRLAGYPLYNKAQIKRVLVRPEWKKCLSLCPHCLCNEAPHAEHTH